MSSHTTPPIAFIALLRRSTYWLVAAACHGPGAFVPCPGHGRAGRPVAVHLSRWHRGGGGLRASGVALGAAGGAAAGPGGPWRCRGDARPDFEIGPAGGAVADFGGLGRAKEEEMYPSHPSGWLV